MEVNFERTVEEGFHGQEVSYPIVTLLRTTNLAFQSFQWQPVNNSPLHHHSYRLDRHWQVFRKPSGCAGPLHHSTGFTLVDSDTKVSWVSLCLGTAYQQGRIDLKGRGSMLLGGGHAMCIKCVGGWSMHPMSFRGSDLCPD